MLLQNSRIYKNCLCLFMQFIDIFQYNLNEGCRNRYDRANNNDQIDWRAAKIFDETKKRTDSLAEWQQMRLGFGIVLFGFSIFRIPNTSTLVAELGIVPCVAPVTMGQITYLANNGCNVSTPLPIHSGN